MAGTSKSLSRPGHVASGDWGDGLEAMMGFAAVENPHGVIKAWIGGGGFEMQIAGDLQPSKARLGYYYCPGGEFFCG